MRYDSILNLISLKESFPESIEFDDNIKLLINDKQIIINEINREIDQLSGLTRDKGFTVGLKVLVSIRTFTNEETGCSVSSTQKQYGDFYVLPYDATLKDVMETIDKLVCSVRNHIVGEAKQQMK